MPDGTVDQWLRAVAPTGVSMLSRPELTELLTRLFGELTDSLAAQPVDGALARHAGGALVEAGFVDPVAVQTSVPLLGAALLSLARQAKLPDPVGSTFAVVGAFSAGFVAALEEWIFVGQEEIKVALHRATDQAQRQLRHSEARFREVFLRAGVGIAISDTSGKIAQVNPALADMLGVQAKELVGRGIEEFLHPQDADDAKSDYDALTAVGGKPLRRRRRFVRPDGQLVWAYLTASALRDTDDSADDTDPPLHLTMVENVSDLHLLQDLTTQQALHDALTGLPNRQYLLSQLQSMLGGGSAAERVTLYHLDLDGFAAINDGIGPYHGDRLLSVVAKRIDALFAGHRALVARLGGDEFAVLIPDGSTSSEVLETVGRINTQLAEPVHMAHGGVGLSACIGVAHGQVGRTSAFELLRTADSSLRRAQRAGSRQWVVYDEQWDSRHRRTSSLAATLGGALEFGELEVLWQPWVSFAESGGLAGVSVRVRWPHGELGVVEHNECLELADLTGASLPLSGWLLGKACRLAKSWPDRFDGVPLPLGVALSATQIADPDLIGTIGAALDTVDLRPAGLCLGVPAPALLSLDSEAAGNLSVLIGMGVRVVFTDVGVTPRDMAVLDEWPAAAVQMAAPLVRKVVAAKPDSMLARMAGALAGTLRDAGLTMLVPGVRTAAQVQWWRSVGASAACGPYFGRPLTEEQLIVKFGRRTDISGQPTP